MTLQSNSSRQALRESHYKTVDAGAPNVREEDGADPVVRENKSQERTEEKLLNPIFQKVAEETKAEQHLKIILEKSPPRRPNQV